ncbi:DUF3391 domain-containing protein, partial [Isoptericola rhizosphaerae]|uniref:DUF3391 domain-containing protein n=1 Tax=Isoptericola rhizosphaerae TaxID=3377837 RepID=UPI00383B58B7
GRGIDVGARAAMLKKVTSAEVCLGMYIHKFEGSWIDHPFWKARFLLHEPRDLQKIQDSAVTAVWIDIAKGLDCRSPSECSSAQQPAAVPEPVAAPVAAPAALPAAAPTPETGTAPVAAISCPQEMAQASAVSRCSGLTWPLQRRTHGAGQAAGDLSTGRRCRED